MSNVAPLRGAGGSHVALTYGCGGCARFAIAMLRFKRETGREITDIALDSLSDLCVYLWCCVSSAANRDGCRFDMDFMTFADNISPDDMQSWAQSIGGDAPAETADDGEKKSPSAS